MRCLLVFALALATVGCDAGTSTPNPYGETCTTPRWICSTAACSQFPTTPGCSFQTPTSGLCPFSAPHCWDPTTSKDYCPSGSAVCAQPRSTCPSKFCSEGEVAACSDALTVGPFCTTPSQCIHYGCGDMGTRD